MSHDPDRLSKEGTTKNPKKDTKASKAPRETVNIELMQLGAKGFTLASKVKAQVIANRDTVPEPDYVTVDLDLDTGVASTIKLPWKGEDTTMAEPEYSVAFREMQQQDPENMPPNMSMPVVIRGGGKKKWQIVLIFNG